MAQLLTERGTSTAPTGVVSVADLLSRYAPDPTIDPEPATMPVSVGSLLRREGHAPYAAEDAAMARAPREPDGYEDEPGTATPSGRRPTLRRSAIAAGILLAAGSVFGATTMISNSSGPTDGAPQPTGGYPGQGILDPQQQPSGAIPTVVDNTAQSDPLDPGVGAPTSWMPTAFPDGPGGGPSGPTGSATPPPAGSGAPQGSPLVTEDGGAGDDQGADQDSGTGLPDQGGDDQGGNDQGGNDQGDQGDGDQGGNDQGGDDQGTPPREESRGDGLVGQAVENLGSALPDPLGNPVQSLGRTVSGLL